jgi:hypothetical protein
MDVSERPAKAKTDGRDWIDLDAPGMRAIAAA